MKRSKGQINYQGSIALQPKCRQRRSMRLFMLGYVSCLSTIKVRKEDEEKLRTNDLPRMWCFATKM